MGLQRGIEVFVPLQEEENHFSLPRPSAIRNDPNPSPRNLPDPGVKNGAVQMCCNSGFKKHSISALLQHLPSVNESRDKERQG